MHLNIRHDIVIKLDDKLSAQVDRLLDLLEAHSVDVSRLKTAAGALEGATDKLGETVEQNKQK